MTMRRALFAAVPLMLLLAGCATGPKYTEVVSTLPSLTPSEGRIYFYRPSALGAAVQPEIKLNGQKVGTAKPHGFYFVDRAPGLFGHGRQLCWLTHDLRCARGERERTRENPQ